MKTLTFHSEVRIHVPNAPRFVRRAALLWYGLGLMMATALAAERIVAAEPVRYQLETVQLAPDSVPAQFSFQKARGQLDYPGERAGTAAGRMLGVSTTEPLVDTVLSVATFTLSPIMAAKGAMDARKVMPGAKLSECEADLNKSMAEMAKQKWFHQCLVRAADEKCPGRMISFSGTNVARQAVGTEAILQARIENLRLEKTGTGDTSYALQIQARARLVRLTDHVVLEEERAEYRSGTALFLDWTLRDALEGVAQTGYRQLAEELVARMLSTTDEPLLVGAAFPNAPQVHVRGGQNSLREGQTVVHRVSYSEVPEIDPFGISFSANMTHVNVQRPLTRDEIASEAIQDLEWQLDGLDNHPNLIVMLGATVSAVPLSLWKQSAAAVQGFSSKTVKEAASKLDRIAVRAEPAKEIAFAVAEELRADSAPGVVLTGYSPRQGRLSPETGLRSLEIHVESAGLRGKHGSNPKLAFCLEAKAALRSPEGRQLYACPIRYETKPHRLKDWAAQDGRLFRDTLQQSSLEISTSICNRLLARKVVPRTFPTQSDIVQN